MVIREANPEDALAIAIVNVYTWKTQYTGLISDEIINNRVNQIEQVANRIRNHMNGDSKCMVVEQDSTVVGFVRYGASRNEEYNDCGEIYALYILDGFQGKGLGRKLFDIAKNDLKERGYNNIIINCLKGNNSLEFYKHMGGVLVSEGKFKVNETDFLLEDVLLFNI